MSGFMQTSFSTFAASAALPYQSSPGRRIVTRRRSSGRGRLADSVCTRYCTIGAVRVIHSIRRDGRWQWGTRPHKNGRDPAPTEQALESPKFCSIHRSNVARSNDRCFDLGTGSTNGRSRFIDLLAGITALHDERAIEPRNMLTFASQLPRCVSIY